ncbi:MAG: hypothetical protein LH632_13815, partial [Rhodoferax sp.]|nr:hypothetical protein [Rhodoferax sp.]
PAPPSSGRVVVVIAIRVIVWIQNCTHQDFLLFRPDPVTGPTSQNFALGPRAEFDGARSCQP